MINFGEVFDAAIKDTVNDVLIKGEIPDITLSETCLLYTSPSPRDLSTSRMPSSA